jgi:superfamily II DNA or RNA helicase
MDEKNLWRYVLKNAKPSYQASLDEKGKPYKSIANKGLKEGEIAVRGGSEYANFSIKALEDIKPILTDRRVAKAIKLLSVGNIQGTIKVLRINNEVNKEGTGLVYAILKKWLEINNIEVPDEYNKKAIDLKSSSIKNWIYSYNYSPILSKFEIVGIGQTKKGYSVVPESWLGREFNNAYQLHKEMDNLEWRKDKPPTSFCCIYAMYIEESQKWQAPSTDILKLHVKIGIEMFPKFKNNNLISLGTNVVFFNNKKEYLQWLKNLPTDCKIMNIALHSDNYNPSDQLLFACNLDKIIESKPDFIKKETVGVLVSRMQKLIRRGRGCSNILKSTMEKLWKSPNYNIPEQQFIRVSGCRQLVWRLFITTIEDVEPYLDDSSNDKLKYLSMLDIACLAILTNIDPDIQFNETIFENILYTSLLIQHNDKPGSNWKFYLGSTDDIYNIKTNNNILNSLKVLSAYMPMMSGDQTMLHQSFNYIFNSKKDDDYKLKPLDKLSIDKLLSFSNKNDELNGELAGYDMHPYPNILIHMQSAFPFLPYNENHTTKALSMFIWNNSSNINVRNPDIIPAKDKESKLLLKTLYNIQMHIKNPLYYKINIDKFVKDIDDGNKKIYNIVKTTNTNYKNRLAFLLIFGKKMTINHHSKKYDVIMAGSELQPCKIKQTIKTNYDKNDSDTKVAEYLEDKNRYDVELTFIKYFSKENKIQFDIPNPPEGCQWIWSNKSNTKKLNIWFELVKTDPKKFTNDINIHINEYVIKPFDTSSILLQYDKPKSVHASNNIKNIINQALYNDNNKYDDYEINLVMRDLAKFRQNNRIYKWVDYAIKSKIPPIVWKSIIVKLFNNYNNEVQIGPCDKGGNKLHDSINYLYEGTILRMFNMLSMLYPKSIIQKTPLKFSINNATYEYIDLIENLNKLAFRESNKNINIKNIPQSIKLKTKLWPHQQKTSDKIVNDMIHIGKKGFGDASNVGAGKTLTALSIMVYIYNYVIKNKDYKYSGFLVLLPTTYLYQTWIDEINKHLVGFDIIIQHANGSLSSSDNIIPKTENDIGQNTIVITTLGRMRDHPLYQSWRFVVIDECLSVQNKSALQSEEAWRQIICSQFGVILASATFFRSRFDKLFYMLKMLRSGLPETKEYLDTILSETIISNIPAATREWNTNINRFKLSPKMMNEYNAILKQGYNSEKLYIKLQKYLFDNFDYVNAFKKVIKESENKGRRCLVYARSKDEADVLAENIDGLSRFPDITGKHVVISYTEGTYGLNNLVFLDTIITKVPAPDKLPQMKGRINRPGQNATMLYLEYIVIKDTIDEASLISLELASSFYGNYIMPLAELYELAVGKTSKEEIILKKEKQK